MDTMTSNINWYCTQLFSITSHFLEKAEKTSAAMNQSWFNFVSYYHSISLVMLFLLELILFFDSRFALPLRPAPPNIGFSRPAFDAAAIAQLERLLLVFLMHPENFHFHSPTANFLPKTEIRQRRTRRPLRSCRFQPPRFFRLLFDLSLPGSFETAKNGRGIGLQRRALKLSLSNLHLGLISHPPNTTTTAQKVFSRTCVLNNYFIGSSSICIVILTYVHL